MTIIGKLLISTFLWCCFYFDFTQFVILENLSILDLAMSGVQGLEKLQIPPSMLEPCQGHVAV